MASSRTLDRLRSRLLRGALAFVLLSAGSLLTPATAASAAATTSAASNYLRVWTPENITPLSLTQDQAVAIAQNFGVVVAGPNAFASYVSAMKAANPSVVLLAYENATFTPVSTLAEGMYAHSSTTIAPSTRILN